MFLIFFDKLAILGPERLGIRSLRPKGDVEFVAPPQCR